MKHLLRPTGRSLGAPSRHGERAVRVPSRRVPGVRRAPRRVVAVLAALLLSTLIVPLAAAQQAGAPPDNAAAAPSPLPPAPPASAGDYSASSPEAPPAPPEKAPEPALPAGGPSADNAASPAEPGAPPAAPTGTIKEIVVTKTPHYTNIEAFVEGKIGSYNSFKLNDPFRIVVDVWGIAQGGAAPEIAADTPQVKSVKLSQQDNKLRILVETPEDKPLPFLVNTENDRIVVSVGGGVEDKVTSMTRPEAAKAAAKGKAVIGIDLEDFADAASVVVTTTGDVPVKTIEAKGKVTLRFEGASAERNLLRAMDAGPMGIPIRKVVPAKVKKGVEVAIHFAAGASYMVDKRDMTVVVTFPKKPDGEKGSVVAALKERRTQAPSAPKAGPEGFPGRAGEEEAAPGEAAPRRVQETRTPGWGFVTHEGGEGRRFIGQRISMDFKDADLSNVFRIIAEVSNLNIITTDDVKGKVTLRLVNVPWDQALDIVLKSKGLGVRQEGNILRIAPLNTLRAEEKARLDSQKEVEKLQASLEGVVEAIPVNYSKASDLQGKIKDLLSEGGKVQIDDRTNTIVIRDIRKNVEAVKALIATLDTATPQVLIEARIVEVDTNFSRELGVQWGGIKQGSVSGNLAGVSGYQDAAGAFLSGLPISNTPDPFENANYAVNLPAAVGQGSGGGIAFGIINSSRTFRLDVALTAMEASGKGKVVSSPKVVTIDNKEATIEQGAQVPYSTVSASGTNTQFVDATLSLRVTPHITPEGSVIMKVEAKNDSVGATGATGQPAINKKKATTEVLVRDGETAVIGGILQVSRNENQQAVPWLSKIPILGYLFRKDTTSTTNRELLIFITPKIIKQEPVQAKAY